MSDGVIFLGPQAKTTDLERGSVMIGIDEESHWAASAMPVNLPSGANPGVLVGVAANVL